MKPTDKPMSDEEITLRFLFGENYDFDANRVKEEPKPKAKKKPKPKGFS